MSATHAATSTQLLRYAAVGLASNAALFGLYLVLTGAGLAPTVAMSLAYAAGVAQTFFFNRAWTFGHGGAAGSAFARYVATYGIGYLVNLLALQALVEGLGLPHRWVQGTLILCVALLVFTLQKLWVFRPVPAAREVQRP
jgi:putative flippase GtrA